MSTAHAVQLRSRPLEHRRAWFWFCQTCIQASDRDYVTKLSAFWAAESHSIKGLRGVAPNVEVP